MKKYAFIVLPIIILGIIIFYIYKEKEVLYTPPVEENKEDITLYNKILQSSTTAEDVSKCEEIKDKNIQEVCISSIEAKFDPLSLAKTTQDCDKLDTLWDQTKQERIDICYYNIVSKNATNAEDITKCEKIKNKDIQETCMTSIETKFNDESKVTSLEWCDTLKETKTESKELRVDVCRYNKIKLVVNWDNYEELCSKIKTKDINEICLNDYKNLPKLKDIPMMIPPLWTSNSWSSNSWSKGPPPIIMPY